MALPLVFPKVFPKVFPVEIFGILLFHNSSRKSFSVLPKSRLAVTPTNGLDAELLEETDHCPFNSLLPCLRRLALWFFPFLPNPLS